MSEQEVQIGFFASGPEPRGYGHQDAEILVMQSGAEQTDRIFLETLKQVTSRAVILTDDLPVQLAASELDALVGYSRYPDITLNMSFRNFDDLHARFTERLINQARFTFNISEMLTMTFNNLAADVERSLQRLSPLFSTAASYDFFISRLPPMKKPQWHVDFRDCSGNDGCVPDPKHLRAVRPLTALGTLVAFNDSVTLDDSGHFRANACGHAGQGLYVIKGDTVHTSPPTEETRWIYGVSTSFHP